MNVTIYLKSTGSKEGLTYIFTKEEYKRLRTDFETYLTAGMPKGGSYQCQLQTEEISPIIKELLVDFDSVALIDVQVQLDRIKELQAQVEEAKHLNQQARKENEKREKGNRSRRGEK